jgi:hypothetical protein
MKKFIIRLLSFLGILLIGLVLLNTILPVYWGNLEFAIKAGQVASTSKKSEILFVGSSRTYRQVIPSIISDSLQVNSYNLGSYATYGAECIALTRSYIFKELQPKFLVLELQNIQEISDGNLNTARSNYYIDYTTYKFVCDYYNSLDDWSTDRKEKAIDNYKTSFLKRTFFYGTLKDAIYYIKGPKVDERMVKLSDNGFYSLETQLAAKKAAQSLKNRRAKFLVDPSQLLNRRNSIDSIYNHQNGSKANKVFLTQLTQLIELGKKCDIKVVYVLYPKMNPDDYTRLLPIANAIPEDNLIDLANPVLYPDLYEIENSFDLGHLNDKGAYLLSHQLAKKLKTLQ